MKKFLFYLVAVISLVSCASTPRLFEYSMPDAVSRVTMGDPAPAVRFYNEDFGVDFIRLAQLSGSHEKLGRLIGEVSKKTVVHPRRIAETDRELNGQIIAMYRDVYPAYIEELGGIASECGMKLEDIDLRFMEREFFVNLGWLGFGCETSKEKAFRKSGQHCSSLAYRLPDACVALGRNFDYPQANGFVVQSALEGDLASIGNGFICLSHWVMDGVNERGLALSVMTVGDEKKNAYANSSYPDSPAIDAHHLMRIILNTCGSFDEAAALASRVRVWFGAENVHFLVADAAGDMGVFEFDALGKLHIQESETGESFLLSTNDWLTDTPLVNRLRCWRYATARHRLTSTRISGIEDLLPIVEGMAILPNNPLLQDWFPPQTFEIIQTVWTSFYDLSSKTMKVRFWLDKAGRWFEFTPKDALKRSARTSW